MFIEKTKLKDDSSNDVDWVRDLRIILIVAEKNYVLDALLGTTRENLIHRILPVARDKNKRYYYLPVARGIQTCCS